MKKILCILLLFIIISTMSFVSAEDNPTVNESTDDNVIENYNLTMLNEIDYISIGTVEKYPMSIINEKQSNYVSSPNNYTVEYYDCTFDGNITLKITIFNSMNGKIYFSFLNNTGIGCVRFGTDFLIFSG